MVYKTLIILKKYMRKKTVVLSSRLQQQSPEATTFNSLAISFDIYPPTSK